MPRLHAAPELQPTSARRVVPGAVPEPRARVVLYVLTFIPTYVDWELRELARRGVAVRVVLSAPWPRAAMWESITGADRAAGGGLDLRTIDFHAWLAAPARSLAGPAAALLWRQWRRSPRLFARLALACLRDGTFRHLLAATALSEQPWSGQIDRVHGHFATDAAEVGALLARRLGVPFTLTTHARDLFVPRHPRRVRRLLARAAQVLTISEFNRETVEALAGPSLARPVRVLRLGVDVAALPARAVSPDGFRIVCTASGLGEKKGVRVLLEACRLLQARRLPFECEISGADPQEQRLAELRALVCEQGLATNVRVLGALPWPAALARVARAGVFVHPSIRTADGDMDGIPVSLIEACGIGVPVVASRLSGIPELVEDGRTGLLVPPGDAAALADAIERVARQPSSAEAMAARARERVRDRFGLAGYVDGLLDTWDGANASGGGAGRGGGR